LFPKDTFIVSVETYNKKAYFPRVTWLIVVAAFFVIKTVMAIDEAVFLSTSDRAEPVYLTTSDDTSYSDEKANSKVNIRGRLFIDKEYINQSELMFSESYISKISVRTAEVNISGLFMEKLSYEIEMDISGWDFKLGDTFIEYATPLPSVRILAGHLKPVNLLSIKSKDLFLENTAIERAFRRGLQLGAGLFIAEDNWTGFFGYFNGSVEGQDGDRGITYSSRVTFAPPLLDKYMLHIGGYLRNRKYDEGEPLFRYSSRSVLRSGSLSVDSGAYTDKDMLYGLELAGGINSFSVEGQCMLLKAVPLTDGGRNKSFNGCYLTTIWFLTGEKRRYREGRFQGVNVTRSVMDGGRGIWQIAVRYDTIDLDHREFTGGEQSSWTLNMNWYLSNQLWLTMDYMETDVKSGRNAGAGISGFGLRMHLQVDW